MYCIICGDENSLSSPRRFWSPDDGWMVGRFCRGCAPLAAARPRPDDYAYDRRGDYLADEDQAIDVLCG